MEVFWSSFSTLLLLPAETDVRIVVIMKYIFDADDFMLVCGMDSGMRIYPCISCKGFTKKFVECYSDLQTVEEDQRVQQGKC